MIVQDLTSEYEKLYCVCLEDWSDEMREAGDHKEKWLCRMKPKGLRVKLAYDDRGEVGGMIHYIPVEESFVDGRDLYDVRSPKKKPSPVPGQVTVSAFINGWCPAQNISIECSCGINQAFLLLKSGRECP